MNRELILYIFKRLMHAIPILFGISIISFCIIQLAPGDYFTQLELNPAISLQVRETLREQFGFNKPLLIQYWRWLVRLCHGDLGYSLAYNVPVSALIVPRMANTLLLSLAAMFVVWIAAVPLGVWASRKRYSFGDYLLTVGSFVGISLPAFFIAFILLYITSLFGILPAVGVVDLQHGSYSLFGKVIDYTKHLFIPVSVLAIGGIAGLFRIVRANMTDELSRPYIITARVKGLSGMKIVYKHAFRNAVNPLITLLGFQLSALLSGAALIEIIVSWPGLGSLLLDAVLKQDLFVVMGAVMLSSTLLIIGNLMADIILVFVDPRIRRH